MPTRLVRCMTSVVTQARNLDVATNLLGDEGFDDGRSRAMTLGTGVRRPALSAVILGPVPRIHRRSGRHRCQGRRAL